MSFKVTTAITSTPAGATRYVAKGQGKQATVKPDLSKSNDWNHGNAAGTLLLKLGTRVLDLPVGSLTHDQSDDGTVHTFTVGA